MGVHEFEGSFGEDYLYPMLRPIDAKKEASWKLLLGLAKKARILKVV
jgi:hypothetical protein